MQPESQTIFELAVKLPETERLTLVTRLLETMPEEAVGSSVDDPDFVEELKRRSADSAGAVPWTELRDAF